MRGYLTYCYCKQDSEKFEKLEEKTDPNFKEGTYTECHNDIRKRISPGDYLFLRTNWRQMPYVIGYYEINEKRDGEFGKILVAKNRVCIDFNLQIDKELLAFLRPGLKMKLKPEKMSWARYVNYTLGCRKYITLHEEKAKKLVNRIKQNGWA